MAKGSKHSCVWPETPPSSVHQCFCSCGQLPSLFLLARLKTLWGPGSSVPVHCFVDEEKAKQDPSYYLKNTNTETRETLQELYREFKGDEILAATMKAPEKKKVDQLNAVSELF